MRFQLRVIAVTLTILITTLVLNSVLSLASFEKLYLASLVSTLELAGKNLKRKIEQALRFGKPFENFKGLDTLLAEVVRDNPEITSVGVCNPQGKILYHTDETMISRESPLPVPALERGEAAARTQLIQETYVTSVALFDRSEQLVGVIHLSFPRAVITQRLQLMATENAKVLWIVVLLTSLGLVVGMTFWVTRPVRAKILEISGRLSSVKGLRMAEEVPTNQEDASAEVGETLRKPLKLDLTEDIAVLQADFLEKERIENELKQLEVTASLAANHCQRILEQHREVQAQEHAVAAVGDRLAKSAVAIRQVLNQPQAKLADADQSRLAQLLQEHDCLLAEVGHIVEKSEGAGS